MVLYLLDLIGVAVLVAEGRNLLGMIVVVMATNHWDGGDRRCNRVFDAAGGGPRPRARCVFRHGHSGGATLGCHPLGRCDCHFFLCRKRSNQRGPDGVAKVDDLETTRLQHLPAFRVNSMKKVNIQQSTE